MATKKTTTPKEGIFLKKNSKGFFITIKQNQYKLATLGGYNTRANAQKGLMALRRMLNQAVIMGDTPSKDKIMVIDLTKK